MPAAPHYFFIRMLIFTSRLVKNDESEYAQLNCLSLGMEMSASERFTIANSTQGYAPTWNLSRLWDSLRSSRIPSK
jgi:hypothetical protein